MRHLLVLLISLLVLAGCNGTAPVNSSDTSGSAGRSSEPTPTRESDSSASATLSGDPGSGFGLGETLGDNGFGATVTGDITLEFTGDGYFGCENGFYAVRDSSAGLQHITLLFPANSTPGTFHLPGSDGVQAMVSTNDNRVYAGILNGVIVLNAMPLEPGQSISGSFDFTATNGSAQVIASGQFDFMVAPGTIFCQ